MGDLNALNKASQVQEPFATEEKTWSAMSDNWSNCAMQSVVDTRDATGSGSSYVSERQTSGDDLQFSFKVTQDPSTCISIRAIAQQKTSSE
jgi:hypothetical protein